MVNLLYVEDSFRSYGEECEALLVEASMKHRMAISNWWQWSESLVYLGVAMISDVGVHYLYCSVNICTKPQLPGLSFQFNSSWLLKLFLSSILEVLRWIVFFLFCHMQDTRHKDTTLDAGKLVLLQLMNLMLWCKSMIMHRNVSKVFSFPHHSSSVTSVSVTALVCSA